MNLSNSLSSIPTVIFGSSNFSLKNLGHIKHELKFIMYLGLKVIEIPESKLIRKYHEFSFV